MDIVKNGESSTSPLRQSAPLINENGVNGVPNQDASGTQSRLILPEWDVYPLKPIHASQDLVSLLHLEGLYQTHVLPYSEVVHETGVGDGQGGTMAGLGKKKAKAKMEKGYQHLLPDCIDPVPAGDKVALLPLISDFDQPPSAPPELPEGPLPLLSEDAFRIARLEPGTQEGYERGEKKGVKEAEAKRRRRRETRKAQSMSVGPEGISLPSPALAGFDHPTPSSPGIPPPIPSQYDRRPSMPHARTGGFGTPRGGGTPGRGGMYSLGKRPLDGAAGGGTPKRGRGMGFRMGSETPTRGRGRPAFPQNYRSKTEY